MGQTTSTGRQWKLETGKGGLVSPVNIYLKKKKKTPTTTAHYHLREGKGIRCKHYTRMFVQILHKTLKLAVAQPASLQMSRQQGTVY